MHTQTFVIPIDHAKRNEYGEIVVPFDPLVVGSRPVVLLTPRWDDTTKPAKAIPTVTGVDNNEVTIADNSDLQGYYLNVLIINPDIKAIHLMPASAQSIHKEQVMYAEVRHSDDKALHFLTPFWDKRDGPVDHVEMMTFHSSGKPTATSLNASASYYVNHVNTALDPYTEMFAEIGPYVAMIKANRQVLVDSIVNNQAEMPDIAMPDTLMPDALMPELASMPDVAIPKETAGPEWHLAYLLFDSLGLLLSCLGIRFAASARNRKAAAAAIQLQIKNAPTEASAMLKSISAMKRELDAAETAAERAKISGKVVLKLCGPMLALGIVKTVLVYSWEGMTVYQKTIAGIKIVSQLIIIVAGALTTAGAAAVVEAAVWIARLATMIASTGQVVMDIIALANDLQNPGQRGPDDMTLWNGGHSE